MKRAWIHSLVASAVVGGCVVDKQLGDLDSETGTGTDTGSGTEAADTDGPSTVSASSAASMGTAADTAADTAQADTAEPGDGTDGDPESCLSMEVPPFDCELPGDAVADVQTDLPGLMEEATCEILDVAATAADEDTITIRCDDTHEIRVQSSSPHLALPITAGQEVLVTTSELEFAIDESAPSLTLRTTTGELLLAWVDVYGFDIDVDIDIDPIAVSMTPSGCPVFAGDAQCDAGGAITLQRARLEFGNSESPVYLFAGNHGQASTGLLDIDVIARTVDRIVCWDDDCAADDSGPFDRIAFLAVPIP